MNKLICNVCNQNEAKGVAASCLGPVSFAYCEVCLKEGAEPEGMTYATLQMITDDPDAIEYAVADWFKTGIKVYSNGKYLTFKEYLPLAKEWMKKNPIVIN